MMKSVVAAVLLLVMGSAFAKDVHPVPTLVVKTASVVHPVPKLNSASFA